ncbi:MAG TPA: hypothetical protein VK970_03950, partial [Candidatus Methylacidiphilales bacterium]|nr:hypothetical protein [Candidatus Methylacidiphilales bacterium]
RGAALIVTLLILSLLTIMVVGFVGLSLRDRNATQSYTQSLRAQELALSGLDTIVSQLQAQITDPKNNATIYGNGSSSMYIYVPRNTNSVPQRMVSTALNPIVTVSGANVYGTVIDWASVGNISTNLSLNDRRVSISRWCKPQFLPAASTNAFLPPDWVIVTRSGPRAFAAGTAPGGAGLTVSSFTNMNGAVGRYAYVVYDTSGLVDITVAGYPNGASTNAAGKGLLPWADLTRLAPARITANDVDDLVYWRNAAHYSGYPAYVTNWQANGFRWVAPGDTTFLSRQELIDYVRKYNVNLTDALPYLTTFSRELNGPTWGPTVNMGIVNGTNYNYLSNATTAGSANRLIHNVRVQSGGWTRQNGTVAVAGEPLVKYRFPLTKLALLEKPGTTGLTAQDSADILKSFGLVLASDSSGLYRHWNYTSPSGGSPAQQILSLDAVAALGREPDFFELLKAGILNGSLGKGFANCSWTLASMTDYDTSPDYQIIRIGANIISQWTADSYPSTITFNILVSSVTGERENVDFYGIEDLPYINKVFIRANGNAATPVTVTGGAALPGPPYDVYLYFEVWNPHQQTASATGYPANFRIAPLVPAVSSYGRDYYQLGISSGPLNHFTNTIVGWTPGVTPGTGTWPTGTAPNWGKTGSYAAQNVSNTKNNGIVPLTGVTPAAYRNPAIVPGSGASGFSVAGGTPSQVGGIYLGRIPDPSTISGFPGWSALPQNFVYYATDMILPIQYQDSANPGVWRTYGSFTGLPATNIINFQKAAGRFNDSYIYIAPTTAGASLDSACLLKSDPRTPRFGIGEMIRTGNSYPVGAAGTSLTPTANDIRSAQYVETYTVNGASQGGPFFGSSGLAAITRALPYRMDMWAVNASTTTPQGGGGVTYYAGTSTRAGAKAPYYVDNDGVMRPGDACYSYPNSSPLFTETTSSRPIVLNRPFNSVADIGYAFRDTPWKTLDLSSPNSADAGLLDLFTMSDSPVAAGRVNLNTAPVPVLTALLSGGHANISTVVPGSISSLSTTAAEAIAGQIRTAASTSPFLNRTALVNFLATNNVVTAQVPSGIKVEREAAIRALAEPANTRTWNLMIDIIAQSGQYPKSAATLDNFIVTGERRYWLHIAIDRYTGQIVDKQLEVVNE